MPPRTATPSDGQWILLALVLLVATLYRFYGLDHTGLWGAELTHALLAQEQGSIGVVMASIREGTDPPGYRLLLHWVSAGFGSSEVALRALSVVAGVGSVAMVAWLGARCVSWPVGLLAAAWLAGAPLAVRFSQEAQPWSLLLLLGLGQLLCLATLLPALARRSVSDAVAEARWASPLGSIQLQWTPPAGLPAQALLGFWCLSWLALSVAYVAWVILALCLIGAWCWCRVFGLTGSGPRLGWIFGPVWFASVPWWPVALQHSEKWSAALARTAEAPLTVETGLAWLQGVPPLLQALLWLGWALLALGLLRHGLQGRLVPESSVLAWLAGYALAAALLLVGAAESRPALWQPWLMLVQPLFFLLAAAGLAWPVQAVLSARRGPVVMAVAVVAVLALQWQAHQVGSFFNPLRKPDLRPVLSVLADDRAFLARRGLVLVTSPAAEQYLALHGLLKPASLQVERRSSGQAGKVRQVLAENDFYFIDVQEPTSRGESPVSPLQAALAARYGTVCQTVTRSARLMRFSPDRRPGKAAVPDCTQRLQRPPLEPVWWP